MTVHTLVSPTLNYIGPDEPIGLAVQVDALAPQTVYFIPPAAPGTLPAEWDGNDGFVANSIVDAVTSFVAPPGAHTLKVSPKSLVYCLGPWGSDGQDAPTPGRENSADY